MFLEYINGYVDGDFIRAGYMVNTYWGPVLFHTHTEILFSHIIIALASKN